MSDSLIKVEGLSKKFCRSLKKSMWYGVQDLGNELRGRRHGGDGQLRQDEFWAVKDVNFELKRGECLGLIGHNGAGKTTLLRMLNGLIRPDQGRIEMRGTVGALIALGAGFNPILTGRENIYVNASVLGMSKRQVGSKMDEIIDFAEIREFIDSPVQSYSSGMSVRLGFAVAAILIEPDILFLDEVLAVGDAAFAIKCLNVVRTLANRSAVVLVSHNMQHISWFCTRVMVLEKGHVLTDSQNVAEGIDRYYALIKHDTQTSGTGEAEVFNMQLIVNGETSPRIEPVIAHGSQLEAILHFRLTFEANILVVIRDDSLSAVISVPLHDENGKMHFPPGEYHLAIPFGQLDLNAGKYSFNITITNANTLMILARVQGICPFRVIATENFWGKIMRPAFPSQIEHKG
jgi:lipopolysaccharide transport system ATP-binding protein